MGVNPDGSGAEGSAFIPIGHEIQSSISVDENRFVCTGPFEGDIWSGDDYFFPINTLPECTITGGRSETGAGNCFSHDKQDESVRAVSASVIVEKEVPGRVFPGILT